MGRERNVQSFAPHLPSHRGDMKQRPSESHAEAAPVPATVGKRAQTMSSSISVNQEHVHIGPCGSECKQRVITAPHAHGRIWGAGPSVNHRHFPPTCQLPLPGCYVAAPGPAQTFLSNIELNPSPTFPLICEILRLGPDCFYKMKSRRCIKCK